MTSLVFKAAALVAKVLPRPVKQSLYRLGPVTRAIRSWLNTASPQGMTPVTVAGGVGEGIRLTLNLQTEKDLWLGTYEPDLQEAVRRFSKPGMVAYDVGANMGYLSVLLALAVGPEGCVFAFEPLPENLERLRMHLTSNNLENRVRVIPAAVGEKTGLAYFLIHASPGMGKLEGSAGREEDYEREIEVDMIALDEFVWSLGNPPPSMLKIDVEGGEGKVLQGMRRILSDIRPLVLVEIHGGHAAHAVWDILTKSEYVVRDMRRGSGMLAGPDSLAWKAYVIGMPRERSEVEHA